MDDMGSVFTLQPYTGPDCNFRNYLAILE
jgi:hypothetical protein